MVDRVQAGVVLVGLCGACAGDKPDSASGAPEPLVLPADPGEIAMPVGVRTVLVGERSVEVWYPAAEAAAGGAGERVELADLVPDSVRTALGEAALPGIETIAVRDAPLRRLEAPLPVVLFSHGFGGFPQQSVDLTSHLAGRGYVVLSTDHAGRSIGDLLPCLFSPPLDGCGLAADDPGPADLAAIVAGLEADPGFLSGAIDLSLRAVVGHSAGGGTASTFAETDPELDAAVVMAAPPAVTTGVPVLLLDGSCDGIVLEEGVASAFATVPDGVRVRMEGAGHLAFSDICALELGTLAEELLAPRDDVNTALLAQLVGLGTDGCPGGAVTVPDCGTAFLPLETTTPVIRSSTTAFLDAHLRGGPALGTPDYGAAFTVSRSAR